mmetsp:Transcript_2728/g.6343  ORF Transcript_2728/g.6343 Transcript_2728/m.6343 type:complete len:84 (+) Transcript_2728:962-1213(+)
MYETHSTAKWTYLIILAVVERENRRVINGDLMHKESPDLVGWIPKTDRNPSGQAPNNFGSSLLLNRSGQEEERAGEGVQSLVR